jgi:hypothetical protein
MIDKILNPNTKVGDIFPNDVTQAKNIYRDLCKKYHPDTFADDRANDIISALTKIYNNAIKAIEAGTWEKSNFIAIKTTKGTTLNINYLYHRVFELGEYYVCNQHIIYIFDFNKKKYYNNYIKQINKISYKDKKMEKYFKNLFPQVISEYNTLDNKHIIVISKTEDVYPLRAVIENVFNNLKEILNISLVKGLSDEDMKIICKRIIDTNRDLVNNKYLIELCKGIIELPEIPTPTPIPATRTMKMKIENPYYGPDTYLTF